MTTSDSASEWATIRRRGRRRYILLTGVLGWGVPVAVVSTALGQWLGAAGPFWGRLALALVCFSLAGIAFGARMWSVRERQYLESSHVDQPQH